MRVGQFQQRLRQRRAELRELRLLHRALVPAFHQDRRFVAVLIAFAHPRLVQRYHRRPPLMPQPVYRQVHRDAPQPRVKPRLAAQVLQFLIRPHERILHDIQRRVFVAHQPPRHAERPLPVLDKEFLEGLRASSHRLFHQAPVLAVVHETGPGAVSLHTW